MAEDLKKEGLPNEEEDDEFINSLLGDDDEVDPEETEEKKKQKEEELQKNKNAEEARKRREAEAKKKLEDEEKAKAEAESKAKLEAEEKAKKEAEEKAKVEAEKEAQKDNKVKALGAQLEDFKGKYPDVDLKTLDNDKGFRKYIDGKLLGKKDFIGLYEDFLEFKSEITNVEKETLEKNYAKANSSTGPLNTKVNDTVEVFTEAELEEIAKKLPTMKPSEAEKVYDKFEKSVSYYKNKK